MGIEFDERKVPLRPEVNAACEMLGLDSFYVANEGKLVAIVPGERAEPVLAAMRLHEYGKDAAIIGKVVAGASWSCYRQNLHRRHACGRCPRRRIAPQDLLRGARIQNSGIL